jgi:3-hydroxybutyryl-CoA dehydratase
MLRIDSAWLTFQGYAPAHRGPTDPGIGSLFGTGKARQRRSIHEHEARERQMRNWRREAGEGRLRAGTTVRFSRTFTARDVVAFGDITRDYNPVHYEPGFAREKGFSRLVCHGLLVGSMICEPGGQWAWLASGMSFRFLKPVYIGDTITCEMVIQEVGERGRAKARASFANQEGQTVMTAELTGFLPTSREQSTLRRMLAEGDSTNPLASRDGIGALAD